MSHFILIPHNNLGVRHFIIIIPITNWPKDIEPRIKVGTVSPQYLHSVWLRYFFLQFAHTVVNSSQADVGTVGSI